MKFRDLVQGQTYGYVSASPTSKSIEGVIKPFFANLDIDELIPFGKLHATVLYDSRNCIPGKANVGRLYECVITGVKRLGEPGSKWEAIVLVLESPDLQKRHAELKEFGFKHSYPEYIPHLSVKYRPSESDLKILQSAFDNIKGKRIILSENKWERTE